MVPVSVPIILLFGLIAGLMIGCVGIGGVILVPLLSYLGGVDIRVAIAAAMFAYLISGVVGTAVFARKKSLRWDMTGWMWLGAMPAAFAGALTVQFVSGWLLELCIGGLSVASGLHAIFVNTDGKAAAENAIDGNGEAVALKPFAATSIGAFTGFLSALTGTGGPLVLMPILIWLRIPVLTALGLAVAIQLPIAVLATAGNFHAGSLDLVLGGLLGAGILFGTWMGARLAHMLPRALLRRIVSLLLVVVGGLIFLKLAVASPL